MSDLYCAKCGEPWDAGGVFQAVDMTKDERTRFLRGDGCPSCEFGETCPDCSGTGKERGRVWACQTCRGLRLVPVWRQPRSEIPQLRKWHIGYTNTVSVARDDIDDENVRYVRHMNGIESGLATCPDCAHNAPNCARCSGDGKLHVKEEDQEMLEEQFFAAIMETME